MTQPPNNLKNSLGEAMGVLMIVLLLLPLSAITLRGAIEILTTPIKCSTKENEKIIQVSAAPTPVLAQVATTRHQDITKARITKWLTFETKDWEDIFFSAVTHLCMPMFSTSVLLSAEGIAKLLLVPYLIAIISVITVAAWLIRQFPELQALVWGRLSVILLGILLGVAR